MHIHAMHIYTYTDTYTCIKYVDRDVEMKMSHCSI